MTKCKKSHALGMGISTARARLERDIVFALAIAQGHKCFRCGEDMTRDNFSVEHKVAWLSSEDPKATFFDLDNIAFSHHTCNSAAASRPHKKYASKAEKSKKWRDGFSVKERQERRRAQYLRTGK